MHHYKCLPKYIDLCFFISPPSSGTFYNVSKFPHKMYTPLSLLRPEKELEEEVLCSDGGVPRLL